MIALDVMGGDYAPKVNVHGAINAAKKGVPVALFGDETIIKALLVEIYPNWWSLPLSIVHSSDVIEMGDIPSKAVLKKKESSLIRAVQATADGRTHAVVTAGNSGAALVAGTLIIGCADGVLRPALGNFLPTKTGSVFCIDLGANADCKPEYLEQFALMGHLYVHKMLGNATPRVALLSNGTESYKGSMVVKEAFIRMSQNPILNFIGNLEPRTLFEGTADVLVSDGFSGNIMLKTAQGTLRSMMSWLKEEAHSSLKNKLLFYLMRPILTKLKERTDYSARGGALLLGLKKPFVVTHGCSNEIAIENALLQAHSVAQKNFISLFNEELHELMRISSLTKVPERKVSVSK